MHTIDKARWPVLSPLLDELLDLDEPARADRLTVLRAQDPASADDLVAMLARMDRLDDEAFLDAPALPPPAELAGQAVGAYTLERELGQGGMGSVWLARRTDGRYQGNVAIKFLNAGLFSAGNAGRFEREGSILARLDHPHIARLLDAGLAHSGSQPYLVLEYIAGEPIDRYCAQQALSTTAKVRLFLDVLAAVAHAHNRLILHRDLKPSNILVTPAGQVKLLDFGIAKLLDDTSPSAAGELTQRAGNAYTPQFAAPEQVQGGDVTTATDVYALGVTLYLLLAGQHPTVAVTESPLDQMRAVVETEPRPLSDTVRRQGGEGAAKRVRELRGDLDTIVARALKKAPTDRYANAADLADDLRRCLNNQPIAARPDSPLYRAGKFLRRNWLPVAAGSVTALAIAVGVTVALREGHEARRQQLQAEGLIEFMLGDLRKKLEPIGRLDALQVLGSKALAYYAAQDSGRLDDDSLGRRARALHLIGELAEKRGDMGEASRSFGQAAEMTSALLARAPGNRQRIFEQAQSEYWVGYIAMLRGERDAAEQAWRRYLMLAQRLVLLDPQRLEWQAEVAMAHQNLGVLYLRVARWDQALSELAESRTTWERVAPLRPAYWADLGNALGWLAVTQEASGAYQAAIDVERAKVEALSRAPGADTDRRVQYLLANARHAIARRLLSLGRIDEAAHEVQRALAMLTALSVTDTGNLDWQAQTCYSRLLATEIFVAQNQSEAARAQLAQVDAVVTRLLSGSPDKLAWQVQVLGGQMLWQARLAPAGQVDMAKLQEFGRSIQRVENRGKSLDTIQARMMAKFAMDLGDRLTAAGRPGEARDWWQDGARRARKLALQGDLAATAVLALILLRIGETAEARALSQTLQTSAYRHPDTVELRQRLAQLDRALPGT